MKWLTIENSENADDPQFPEWARTVGITDQGLVFVPAGLAGSEDEVAMCMLYDGTESHLYRNHTYVPADWMAAEFPKTIEACKSIVLKAQAATLMAALN